ncbi:MAG: extracellular solute-binding protein, partial [Chloroflexi bacterium]|nr:extracellular solute-binding protein [Chloroflexota bacterium]
MPDPRRRRLMATQLPYGTLLPTLVLSVLLAACGPAPTAEDGAGALAPEVSEGGDDDDEGTGDAVRLLMLEHPWTTAIEPFLGDFTDETGIEIEFQTFSQDQARDRLLVTLQSQSAEVDAFMSLKSREGLAFHEAGYYEPLDAYVGNEELTLDAWDFDDFGQAAIEGETFDEQLIGLPILVEGPVVYYRKDLFETYGLQIPSSIDELVEAARVIDEG